jgi:hypothetical protein
MRIWGRVPICKTSRPDPELGIQNHTTLLRKARKEVIHGRRNISKKVESKDQSQEEKGSLPTLWFKRELRNKIVLGVRSCWQRFSVQVDK